MCASWIAALSCNRTFIVRSVFCRLRRRRHSRSLVRFAVVYFIFLCATHGKNKSVFCFSATVIVGQHLSCADATRNSVVRGCERLVLKEHFDIFPRNVHATSLDTKSQGSKGESRIPVRAASIDIQTTSFRRKSISVLFLVASLRP